jgi:hypothetical protein
MVLTAGGGAQVRAIDSLKTSEKRGFHEVDGAPCQERAGMVADVI